MVALQGRGVSSGIASGPLYYYKRSANAAANSHCDNPDTEISRYKAASQKARDELGAMCEKARAEAGDEAASLFEAHQLMLDDLDYTMRIEELIRDDKLSAENAVISAGKEFSEMFASMDDEYMRARSVDILDISTQTANILSGTDCKNEITSPVIIFADDLSPGETVRLDKRLILGFILSHGNANSHTAILARSLGIPAVINTQGEPKPEYEGRFTIMDASVGYVVIDPDESTKTYLEKKQREERAVRSMLEQLKGKPDVTADGKKIKLYANITTPDDIDAVITNDAQGIGLFRSEFLYLGRSDFPSEEAQLEAYKSVVSKMDGKPVIIRTMDIGADKKIDYLNLSQEENPALGMRALRICLSRPEIFKTQLRAIYRASAYGKTAIMFPMVSNLWEVQEAKRICFAVMSELRHERIAFDEKLQIGIMIETPAAVIIAPELAREVDFFSIGTNDLTQYTIALDRQSVSGLERFYDAKHPAVLSMIKMTADAAHQENIWVGICGELAADTSLTEEFLKMGIDELSVSSRSILPVRSAIRHTDLSAK